MHWPICEDHLVTLLPEGVELDRFEGQAWIGIVPFRMSGVAARWLPPLPWLSRFPEVTVRTYVIVDGKPGLWYFSLDATSRFAVLLAKCIFALPYSDSKIAMTRDGMWRRFFNRRTEAGRVTAELDVEYRPVGPVFQAPANTLDHWLTARYCLYTRNPQGEILRGEIDHAPWRLRNVQAIVHRNTMVNALGLALPDQCPRVLYSDYNRVGSWRNKRIGCPTGNC